MHGLLSIALLIGTLHSTMAGTKTKGDGTAFTSPGATVSDPFGDCTATCSSGTSSSSYSWTLIYDPSGPDFEVDSTVPANYSVRFSVNSGAWVVGATAVGTLALGATTNIHWIYEPVSQIVVSGFPSPSTAASTGSITVEARDQYGYRVLGYTGTVAFTSSDPQAVLPSSYTFVAGDHGIHTFTGLALKTAGVQSFTASDGTRSSSQAGITVNPAAANHFLLSGISSPRTAGATSSLVVDARDNWGNRATGYVGTVHFTSTDGQAVLPANYSFTSGDAGVHTFTGVALKTSGSQGVTGTDTVTGTTAGAHASVTVNPDTANEHFVVSGLTTPRTAGVAGTLTVAVRDEFNNSVPTYTGTVHFTSTDLQAVLPANYSFVSGDSGTHSFTNGVILKTTGSWNVVATDTSAGATGSQTSISVTAGAVSALVTSGITTPTVAGVARSVIVSAKDAYGNLATSYTGTIHFVTSDAQGNVPSNYAFVSGDGGQHTFSNGVLLKTAGAQSVTATDTGNGSLTAAQTGISVTPAAASSIVVSGFPSSVNADTTGSITAVVKDAFQNVATGYLGTLHLSSTDGQSVLSANYTMVGADAGTKAFSGLKLRTAGTQQIAVTQADNSAVTGFQGGIVVSPDPNTFQPILTISSSPTAGVWQGATVRLQDGWSNTFTTYNRTISFSVDHNASHVDLPANYAFVAGDSGVHVFSSAVRFRIGAPDSFSLLVSALPPVGSTAVTVSQNLSVLQGETNPPSLSTSPGFGAVYPTATSVVNFSAVYSDAETGVDPSTVSATLRGGGVTFSPPATSTGASASLLLNVGANAFTFSVRDWLGNTASTSTNFYYDIQPPALTITSPQPGVVLTGTTIPVQGTVTDDDQVASLTVNGASVPVSSGSFTTSVSVPTDGPQTITAVATDRAGHQTTAIVTVTTYRGGWHSYASSSIDLVASTSTYCAH